MNAYVVAAVVLAALGQCSGLSCIPCGEYTCNVPKCGEYGTVKGVCGCCDVCAKVPGESCGGMWGIRGRCGKGLVCEPDLTDERNEYQPLGHKSGICVKADANEIRDTRAIEKRSAGGGLLGRPRKAGARRVTAREDQHIVHGNGIPANIQLLLNQKKKSKWGEGK